MNLTPICAAARQVLAPVELPEPDLPIDPRELAALLDYQQICDLGIGYHGALENLRTGRGTWDDGNTLACAANIALVLCEAGIGGEYLGVVCEAQGAIARLVARGDATGRYALDGPGLQAVRDLLELHDQQLEHEECTRARMRAALHEVERRMAQGQVITGERIDADQAPGSSASLENANKQ